MAFTISIDRTTSPVAEGEQLDVTAIVENTGADPAQKEVALTVGDSVRDSVSVNLEDSQSKTVTLTWQTRDGDAGEYGAAVSSPDETDTAVVAVQAATEVSVSITGTNAPVTEGETLYVDVQAQNLKGGTIAQTIVASLSDPSYEEKIKDKAADSARLVLDPDETVERTLEIDAGAYGEGAATTYDREIWVGSETDTASTTVTVRKPSQFDITVDSTNAPVAEGEPLEVTATVENTGGESGAVTAALAAKNYTNSISNAGSIAGGGDDNSSDAWKEERLWGGGPFSDSNGLDLDPGQSEQVTLEWDTAPGDEGEHVINAVAIPPWERDEWDGPVFAASRSSAGPGAGCDVPVGVRAGSDPTTVTVSERAPQTPRFSVAIDSTNAPVEEGEDLEVTATVTNTGGEAGIANIALTRYSGHHGRKNTDEMPYLRASEPTRVKTDSLPWKAMDKVGRAALLRDGTGESLDSGESKTVTLTWQTVPGDAGDRVVGVSAIPPWEEDEWDGPVFSVTEAGGEQHVEALGSVSPAQVGGDATVVAVDRHGPMRTGRFKVQIDDVEVPGWQSVTIPSRSTEQGEYREGNDPDYEKKVWGQTTFDDLEMERGLRPGDTKLHDWVEDIQAGNADSGRKEIAVILLDEEGAEQIRWEFQDAWIKQYDPPELDASADGDVATEEITVAYDQMARKEQ
jgi:phage tail-like protein